MKSHSTHSAEIKTFRTQAESGPARLASFVGEPYVFVRTQSPRWARYVGQEHQLSLLTFHTPDGPLLTMCFRHHECFTFVVCDFGEPDVRRMLDSWRKQRGLQIQMVLGNKLVWHLEPARDSEIEELDRFREEVKTNDELAFVRSLAFARENGLLEEYAAQEATQRPRRLPKEGLVIEVNMLYTERFVDATVAYLK